MTPEFTEGQEFKLPIPFWLASVLRPDGSYDDEWVVGTHPDSEDDRIRWANGEGTVTYKVIAHIELPAPYQPRVFYRRHFTDPDGSMRGQHAVEVRTVSTFRRYTRRGWRFDYTVLGSEQ